MLSRRTLPLLATLAALFVAACGRTEFEDPFDIPARDATDVPTDRGDTPIPTDTPCTTNAQCDNRIFCDGVETCVAGRCVAGPPIQCIDMVDCTVDRCDEATRSCVSTPDDSRCMAPARCDVMRGCTSTRCTSNAMCDDGDPCNGLELCESGVCTRTRPPSCDDGIPCTADLCVPRMGCLNRPDNSRCDDGNFCNGTERCDMRARGCVSSPPPNCEDGDPCTINRCDNAARSCVSTALDVDGDGFPPLGCGGSDCDDRNPRVNPGAREVCRDMADNNCNGRVDCADPACSRDPSCMMCTPTGAENSDATCSDGRDNDCNGRFDCDDPACRGTRPCGGCIPTGPERCNDRIDNDCNMLADCADPACSGVPPCGCTPFPEVCGDGRDNDCDSLVDCADVDCTGSPVCGCVPDGRGEGPPDVMTCLDGRDNDCDLRTDCADTACAGIPGICPVCTPTGPENNPGTCTDGRDNDCDGLVDCESMACRALPGVCGPICIPTGPENTPDGTGCRDGRDNDCNGLTDCDDFACVGTPACGCVPSAVENNPMSCSDGRDNDCDRLVDCADPECLAIPDFCSPMCVPTGGENTDFECRDGVDNDCDRLVDCADPVCAALPACGPPPPNDLCTMPLPLAVPGTTTGTTTSARNDYEPVLPGFPGCAGGGGGDVVYTFRVPTTTPVVIDTVGTSFDAVLFVRRNDCEMGSQVACNDDTIGLQAQVAFTAEAGVTYFVFLDGFGIGSLGTFSINVRLGTSSEICTNGRDDDGDGAVDCGDPDCAMDPSCRCIPTGMEFGDAACSDGRDNDCNGLFDCGDPSCAGTIGCCVPTGPENSEAACTDGRDNDCNRLTDCADFQCRFTRACCRPTGPENNTAACSDRQDNDCDGLINCADPECAGTTACCFPSPEVCNDGRDNDCDGIVDCMDPNCTGNPLCGMTCVPTGANEIGVGQCTDGIDNDCDGVTDCLDGDCQPDPSSGAECCNGRDDDGNSFVDEFACFCRNSMDCSGVGAGGPLRSDSCYSSTFSVRGPACNRLGGNIFCNRFFPGTTCDATSGECR